MKAKMPNNTMLHWMSKVILKTVHHAVWSPAPVGGAQT